MIECDVIPPPLVLTKEAMAKVYIKQVLETKKCNSRLADIKSWKIKQMELFK